MSILQIWLIYVFLFCVEFLKTVVSTPDTGQISYTLNDFDPLTTLAYYSFFGYSGGNIPNTLGNPAFDAVVEGPDVENVVGRKDRLGIPANSIDFGGVNAHARVPSAAFPGGTFERTMCAWVKPDWHTPGGVYPFIVQGGETSCAAVRDRFGMSLIYDTVPAHVNDKTVWFWSCGAGNDGVSPLSLRTVGWAHVCVTYRNVRALPLINCDYAWLYLNGVNVGDVIPIGPPSFTYSVSFAAAGDVKFGSPTESGGDAFRGRLDEVMLMSGPLDASGDVLRLSYRCHKQCYYNQGTCQRHDLQDGFSPYRWTCECPDGRFGRHCQYECPLPKTLEECVAEWKQESDGGTCQNLLVRQFVVSGQGNFDRTYAQYVQGFDSNDVVGDGNLCETSGAGGAIDGECWLGLERLNRLFNQHNPSLTTIKFSGLYGGETFEKTCIDFQTLHDSDDESDPLDQMYFAQCFGDAAWADSEFSEIDQALFSTVEVDNDLSPLVNCAENHGGGGWFYRECDSLDPVQRHSFNPTGIYGSTVTGKGVFSKSITGENDGFDSLRIEVCSYDCPNGLYGIDCTLACDPECAENGGTCVFSSSSTFDGVFNYDPVFGNRAVRFVQCDCSAVPERFGRNCQFEKNSGRTIQETVSDWAGESTPDCVNMLIRGRDSAPLPDMANQNWEVLKQSIGHPVDTDFWFGLENLHYFSPDYTKRYSTISYTVTQKAVDGGGTFNKVCSDVVFTDEEDGYKMVHADECWTNGNLLDADLMSATQVRFSSMDKDNKLYTHTHFRLCTEVNGGAWWHSDCSHRTNPLSKEPGGLAFDPVIPVSSDAESIEIEVCRHRCPTGSFGVYCDVVCPENYCENGGVCVYVGPEPQNTPGVACDCPVGFYGRRCQFRCDGDLQDCFERTEADTECMPLVVREDGGVSFSRGIDDYLAGFGDCGTGDCWGGLNNLGDLLSRKDASLYDFSSISFIVGYGGEEYSKTCMDFSVDSDNNFQVDFSDCFGDSELSTDDLLFMRQSKFSTSDYDAYINSCGIDKQAGWWFIRDECHRVLPTGLFGHSGDDTGVMFESLTGRLESAEYVRIDVCNHYQRRSVETVVRHETNEVSFDAPLSSFIDGVGDCDSGDCFESLHYLNYVTNLGLMPMQLELDMDHLGSFYSATCDVRIGDYESGFVLNVKRCSSPDASISVADVWTHNNMKFSTFDVDNDVSSTESCAVTNSAAWWYRDCGKMLPTGNFGENMKFASLTDDLGDSLNRFNMFATGSIHETASVKVAEEYRGPSCRKVLVRNSQHANMEEENVESFSRYYSEYVNGFGDCLTNDCWIGLENLHQMTRLSSKKLVIDVTRGDRTFTLACSDFWISSGADEYRFNVGRCHGSGALDRESLKAQNGRPFLAVDHDVSGYVNCAKSLGGSGWWYSEGCEGVLPTGNHGIPSVPGTGIHYESVTGFDLSANVFEVEVCGVFEEDIVDAEEYKECVPFLSRSDGSISFDRSYEDYVNGFGNPETGEGWLGLRTLHLMTEIPQYLDVKFVYNGEEINLYCGHFSVEDMEEDYMLHINLCNGDDEAIVNNLKYHNDARFSTYDHHADFDVSDVNCAVGIEVGGGFWYPSVTSTEDCQQFHPTGEWKSNEAFRGLNVRSLNGIYANVDSVSMSICFVRERTAEPQFLEEAAPARSCFRDCQEYVGKEFDLKGGEQLFVFESEFMSDLEYYNVHTGPNEVPLVMDTQMKSFFSMTLESPVIFSLPDLQYRDGVTVGQMMYLRMGRDKDGNFKTDDSCIDIQLCGWGETGVPPTIPPSVPVKSAYVPDHYTVIFHDQAMPYDGDVDMFEMTSRSVEYDITFEVNSWIYEYTLSGERQQFPALYSERFFSGDVVLLKYDCKQGCGVADFKSLFVPAGYVVELFSMEYMDSVNGISRKFIGPVSLDVLDGFYMKNSILSYSSALSKIERIEVEVLRFHFDKVTTDEEAETNVNELVVANPTNSVRQVTFKDTYKTYEERHWDESQFLTQGLTDTSSISIETASSFTFSTATTMSIDVFASTSTSVEYLVGSTEAGGGMNMNTGFDTSTEFTTGSTQTRTSDRQVSFESTSGREQGGVVSREETKSFEYECIALPYTKTTCQARQIKGVFDIPYDAVQKYIYTDETVKEYEFTGSIRNTVATSVYFNVIEESLSGYCKYGFSGFGGDCYKGLKMASDDDISGIIEGLKTPTDIEYLPMDFVSGDQVCFQNQGAVISSIHSGMENFHAASLCRYYTPILIGVKYIHSEGKHVNLDGTEFDYSRFHPDEVAPSEDAYVVVDDRGYWRYVAMDAPDQAICVVCKKDLNVQIMI